MRAPDPRFYLAPAPRGMRGWVVLDRENDVKYGTGPRPRGKGTVDGPFKEQATAQGRADRLNARFDPNAK